MGPPSSLVGRLARLACVAALGPGCGLSAAGQGASVDLEGGDPSGSSGGYATSSSGAAMDPDGDRGGSDPDAEPPDGAEDPIDALAPTPPDGGVFADALAARDAASDGGAVCQKLNTCCGYLELYGSSASSVQSCLEAAALNDPSTCESVLAPLESLYLCP